MTSDRPEIVRGYLLVIVEDEQFNTCAFPGGFILMTTGALMHLASNGGGEDEFAADAVACPDEYS